MEGFFSIFLIGAALAMDAFAASVCKGLAVKENDWKNILKVGLFFGVFQALMPIIGYYLGRSFESKIKAYDHWVAFILLGIIGFNMIRESRDKTCEIGGFDFKSLLMLAIATSIDALAVGISFAFFQVEIFSAATIIGITTFVISVAGVYIGKIFGIKYKDKAELAGGIVIILIGIKILIEHLGGYA